MSNEQLDAIQAHRKNHEACSAEVCGSRVCQTARDRDYLIRLALEQASQLLSLRDDMQNAMAAAWDEGYKVGDYEQREQMSDAVNPYRKPLNVPGGRA